MECSGPELCVACRPESGFKLHGGKCVKSDSIVVPIIIFTLLAAGIVAAVYFYKFKSNRSVSHEDYYYHKELDVANDDTYSKSNAEETRL